MASEGLFSFPMLVDPRMFWGVDLFLQCVIIHEKDIL